MTLAEKFEDLWSAENPPDPFVFLADHDSLSIGEQVAVLLVDQQFRHQSGVARPVEEYFERVPEVAADQNAMMELLVSEYGHLAATGEAPDLAEFAERFPGAGDGLRLRLDVAQRRVNPPPIIKERGAVFVSPEDAISTPSPIDSVDGDLSVTHVSDESGLPVKNQTVRRSHREHTIVSEVGSVSAGDGSVSEINEGRIGRYVITRILGEGGFGRVYAARDEELARSVAIKVPHQHRVKTEAASEEYRSEARMLANLDHPNIVPVYDWGETREGQCYVVSKLIEGQTLANHVRSIHASFSEIARIVAQVCEALHYAHARGVIHRDIKPGNILVDTAGTTYVIDFGLALKDEDYGTGARFLGTPAYMSPEQARGEGHLADARSDVFSLGVVLYQLLTGSRPFTGGNARETIEQVMRKDPRPLRVVDRTIPKELERICLRALAKRAVDRYTTALDMAEDLMVFIADKSVGVNSATSGAAPSLEKSANSASTSGSSTRLARIVPKGLRAFDGDDADFFLALLPGAKDRDGLPDSIRFWKTRMAERDADQTFRVGLIYGPSGCGKSSLVKAGLLPRLDQHLVPVYVEATSEETEARILNGIRKRCPSIPEDCTFVEAMSRVRRGKAVPVGRKVVIIIDQFEQWLHTHGEDDDAELVRALRQCDGENLQCVLMVRDDFWLAASRLMRELEVDQVEGRNMATVDLFDKLHARRVLIAFGRAYDRLPDDTRELTKDQTSFVDAAIDGLAEDGKVISVRLALFAEMVKGKEWSVETLKQLGGISGVGVTFLEETFSAATAPPSHRLHEQAVRRVLQALLPEEGTNIKGHMRSYTELLEASGYARRPADFRSLQQLLDTELRLVTPTDPEGASISEQSPGEIPSHEKWYQLTHDYLVPALRVWLTRKQKETARGRAELTLRERSTLWNSKPEQRRLPSAAEWLSIVTMTRKSHWSESQQKMMRSASRYHLAWGAVTLVLLVAVGWFAFQMHGHIRGNALVERLMAAETNQLLPTIEELSAYRAWTDPRLREILADETADPQQRLRASLALLSDDSQQIDYLKERILGASPGIVLVIRDAFSGHPQGEVTSWLWERFNDKSERPKARLGAALTLATLDPPLDQSDERWTEHSDFLAAQIVETISLRPHQYVAVREGLRPARAVLFSSLNPYFVEEDPDRSRKNAATRALLDYAADNPDELAKLVRDADETQFLQLHPLIEPYADQIAESMRAELAMPLEGPTRPAARLQHSRRANAAATLLRLGQPERVWSVLRHSNDPSGRSFLIHRVKPHQVDPSLLLTQLDQETEISRRRALMMALGEYELDELPANRRKSLPKRLGTLLVQDPDAGIHSTAEWLLRRWGQDETLANAREQLLTKGPNQDRNWYVTQGAQTHGDFTMVVIDGRDDQNVRRKFEISTKEVTRDQVQLLPDEFYYNEDRHPDPDCPASVINWFQAIKYCQYLNLSEGIPPEQWCYPPIDEIGTDLLELQPDLTKTGYRLPTSHEWYFACQAVAESEWAFGVTEELLEAYAWTRQNASQRSWPVGLLKPNDFGLFDMYGNVNEWLAESPDDSADSVLKRGGCFLTANSITPFIPNGYITPHATRDTLGLRVARTHEEQ